MELCHVSARKKSRPEVTTSNDISTSSVKNTVLNSHNNSGWDGYNGHTEKLIMSVLFIELSTVLH